MKPAALRQLSRKQRIFALGGLALIVLLIGGIIWWLYMKGFATTDNAMVEGHIVPVSAKVSGTVVEVNFTENEYVEKGTVLVRIDPTDYRIMVEQAEAALETAKNQAQAAQAQVGLTQGTTASQVDEGQAQVAQSRSGVNIAQQEIQAAQAAVVQQREAIETARARVSAAQAQFNEAQQNVRRYRNLRQREYVSQAQLEQAETAFQTAQSQYQVAQQQVKEAQAGLNAAQARLAQARANVNHAQSGVQQSQAALERMRAQTEQVTVQREQAQAQSSQIEQAKAQLAEAKQRLAYTTIVAPASGVVGRKNVEIGQVVQPNQPLFSIVPLENVWVEANFKETDIQGIVPGASAEVEVDAYPGRTFEGVVKSMGAATGSQFSLLPPENASGNFVKVVQWIPVRIELKVGNPNRMLRPGMSAVVTVIRQE